MDKETLKNAFGFFVLLIFLMIWAWLCTFLYNDVFEINFWYHGRDNVQKFLGLLVAILTIVAKMNPAITHGARKEEEKFDYNKDADLFVCPAGHLAMYKRVQGKKVDKSNQSMTYYFDIEKCRVCPLKDGCYKPEAKSRTYSVAIKPDEHKEQEIFQQSEYFKEKSRHRYKIEAKNSELKNVHGYDRANSYGLESMKMQGALAIFVVNLKRILKF